MESEGRNKVPALGISEIYSGHRILIVKVDCMCVAINHLSTYTV